MNIEQYVKHNRITVEVVKDRGAQVDDSGWEHHHYKLMLVWNDGALSRKTPVFDWRQGYAIETVPQDTPAEVLDALVLDAACYLDAQDFEDFAESLGYDPDSRTAERVYMACGEVAKWLERFLGGRAELERVMYRIERL